MPVFAGDCSVFDDFEIACKENEDCSWGGSGCKPTVH